MKNPEDRLPSLQDKLDSVDNQLQNRAYRGAYNKLTNDIRPRIEEWLHNDAAVPANYYTKSELLDLIDDIIARLEALYDVHKDDNQGRGPPEDHPGRGRPDEDEIEGGRGSPDEDEEFGRRPSDDEGHPGGGPDEDDEEDDDDSPGSGPLDDDDAQGNRGNR